jgi:hypothetical protein
MKHLVRTPLGVCEVSLAREGLDLGARGGFEARWATGYDEAEVVGLEDYHRLVKAYLAGLYKKRHGLEPGSVTLNLASHQLSDDLVGWTKLNRQPDR